MLNTRPFILSIVLVVILMITAGLVTARTEVISNPSSHPIRVFNNQEQPHNQNREPSLWYRSPLDGCYDVPLSAAAACRMTEQAPAP